MPEREGNGGAIVGTVRNAAGLPVVGARVRAFAVRLRAEEQLGDAVTGLDGHYDVPTGRAEAQNVRVAVLDGAGRSSASSPVRFGVHGKATIDLTVPEPAGSQLERASTAVAPLLDGVAIADLTAADVAFLFAATGISPFELERLIGAGRVAHAPPPDAASPEPEVREESRSLADVTIRVRETAPGFFEAGFRPNDPHHIARNGYTLDTRRGLRGHTLAEVLDRAEANWRQNYPLSP